MKKKSISISLMFILLVSFEAISVAVVNGQIYEKCPPNSKPNPNPPPPTTIIDVVQPAYSGEKAGYSGWWSSTEKTLIVIKSDYGVLTQMRKKMRRGR